LVRHVVRVSRYSRLGQRRCFELERLIEASEEAGLCSGFLRCLKMVCEAK